MYWTDLSLTWLIFLIAAFFNLLTDRNKQTGNEYNIDTLEIPRMVRKLWRLEKVNDIIDRDCMVDNLKRSRFGRDSFVAIRIGWIEFEREFDEYLVF